jgi:ribosomal protein S27AE
MSTEKMNCPKCGTLMNHHADKPDRSTALAESQTVDLELAGILEVHACPACGNTEVRNLRGSN